MENNAEFLGKLIESYAVSFHRNPNSYVFVSLADSYLKLGNKERALWICREGLKSHPEYTAGLALMGKICYAASDLESAERLCLEVVKKAPDNLTAHKILHQIYWDRGEYQKSLGPLQVLLSQPSCPPLYRERMKAVSETLSQPFNGGSSGTEEIQDMRGVRSIRLVDSLGGNPLFEEKGEKSRAGLYSPGHPASSLHLPETKENLSDPPEEHRGVSGNRKNPVSSSGSFDRVEGKTSPVKDPGMISYEGPGQDLEEEPENPLGVVLKITTDWNYLRDEEPESGEGEEEIPSPHENETDKKEKSFFGLRNIFNLF